MPHIAAYPVSRILRLGLFVGVLALAAALVRGAVVAPASTPAAPVGVATTTLRPTATAAPLAPAAIPRASAAISPAANTEPSVFALALTDADLTHAATPAFPQTVSGVTLRDPVVRVQPNGVRLVATAKVLFGTTQFVLLATPVVSDGRVSVRVDSATLAGIGVPESTKSQVADTMSTTVARVIPANVRVSSVTLAPGTVTIQGTE